jgi:endonuclease IV
MLHFVPHARGENARGLRKKFSFSYAFRHILPHGSYLVNLAQADAERAEQAYNCFVDDLRRCEQLGIGLYNFQ